MMWTELVNVTGLLLWVMVLGIYLLPTLVAGLQQHNQLYVIAGVNLLLGWTILGWIGAVVLVLKPEEPVPNKKKNHRRKKSHQRKSTMRTQPDPPVADLARRLVELAPRPEV